MSTQSYMTIYFKEMFGRNVSGIFPHTIMNMSAYHAYIVYISKLYLRLFSHKVMPQVCSHGLVVCLPDSINIQ